MLHKPNSSQELIREFMDKDIKVAMKKGLDKVTSRTHNPFLFDESDKQIIYGVIPSKSNCYIIIILKNKDKSKEHGSLAKSKALKQYENDFFIQCNKYRNKHIDEYFTLEVDVYYPNQRSDLDNCLKILLDCLQKVGAVENDNKCSRIVANKFLDKDSPRIEFTIKKSLLQ